MILRTCSFCDIGLMREKNQDSVFCGADGESVLAAVADGMGGHEKGEEASGLIREALRDWWRAYREKPEKPTFSEGAKELSAVLAGCNARIRASVPETVICGSTATLLWISQGRWAVLSIGDSRCYLARKSLLGIRLSQISTDDVWENQEEVQEHYTRAEMELHPDYGSLTMAVGVKDAFSCERKEGKLERHSVFFLCSDGVYRFCGEGTLKKALGDMLGGHDMRDCLYQIYQEVYENGAPDNLSAAAVSVR